MKIFALSDPHLSFGVNKPMSIFGSAWENHAHSIEQNWLDLVGPDDVVVMAGDISWAMRFDQALPDLQFIDGLPGKKVLLRGNHDYWWTTLSKMEKTLTKANVSSLSFLRYKAYKLACGVWLAGSRGWLHETESDDWDRDQAIYRRELIRFDMALTDAEKKMAAGDILIAASHFCPLDRAGARTPLSDRIAQSGAKLCIYGHVHNARQRTFLDSGLRYVNTAADALSFRPLLLHDGHRLVYNG